MRTVLPKKRLVAIADDHTLLRSALAKLISTFDNYSILFEAANGKEVKAHITNHAIPDILLLDVNMPVLDGYETAKWLTALHPQIRILALSMYSDEKTIIKMLRLGAKGYILKSIDPDELKNALDSVCDKGFYFSDEISSKIITGLNKQVDVEPVEKIHFTQKEKDFLQLICSELTYKEIAAKMFVSVRSVEDYRNALFEKLNVRTRVSLVLYAIKHGLVDLK
ncbi:MAG TPA: response regulator transcription factor [Puia sp.]|nr:response regulator transcription factor [Puia sp.]